jgi:uncharacterized membrane protein (UPF0127 family)
MSGRVARLLGVVFCLACVVSASHADAPPGTLPLSAFPRERIAIETRASFRRPLFEAWRAETTAQKAQGLMHVPDAAMRPDQAMIFVYEPAQRVSMWMKNTLLSLDMLFVDRRGCIVTIRERAVPQSLATIDSREPVVLVVELKAGTIAAFGIGVGDRVLRLDAGWPPGHTTTPCTKSP